MAPKPESLFTIGTAPRRLYDALTQWGEVTNVQIVRDLHILAYAGVISKVRAAVRPYGLDIAKNRYHGGVWAYRLAVISKMASHAEAKPQRGEYRQKA